MNPNYDWEVYRYKKSRNEPRQVPVVEHPANKIEKFTAEVEKRLNGVDYSKPKYQLWPQFGLAVATDPSSLIKMMKGKKNIVVFYADWCGHCTRLLPTLLVLKRLLEDTGEKYQIISIDADKNDINPPLPRIESFPTVWFFNEKGVAVKQYEGERKPDFMLDAAIRILK